MSPEAFNRVTKVSLMFPITSGGDFARTAGFAVTLEGAGTKATGIVRCDQPRALDLGARSGKKLESALDAIVDELLAKLQRFLNSNTSPLPGGAVACASSHFLCRSAP